MIVQLKKLKLLHPIVEEIWQADPSIWYWTQSQHWNQDKWYFGTSTLNSSLMTVQAENWTDWWMTVKKGDCPERWMYTDDSTSTEGWQYKDGPL